MRPQGAPVEKRSRILIVDNERHNRAVLEVMLAPEGFLIETAESGEDALARVAQQAPDLILLDVLMPGIGGYQVATELKTGLVTKHIPIIMITALDDRDAKLSALGVGAEDFLTKPVDRAELCMRVRNLLRLKDSADEALRHRDDAMGMVSHDLRNLLNGIVQNATLVSDDAAAADDDRGTVDGMKRILGYAARMNRLIGDLVDVVSIDAGKLALERQRSDAVGLLAEAVEGCAHTAAQKGISIECKTVEPELLASFDRERILQVLANLLSNALKFTARGGTIVLRGERKADELHLSVSDTGKGMPSDMLESVFQRFVQIGKNAHKGLGLGLYISRCIVESHGGRIWADSTLDVGSAFHFTLPGTIPTTVMHAC